MCPSASDPTQSGSPDTSPIWLDHCIICRDTHFTPLYPRQFEWLQSCTSCGLTFSQPQASDTQLDEIYDEDYYKTFGFDPDSSSRYRVMKQASFGALLEVAEEHFSPGRLLDVGSALGDLLVAAQDRNWDVHGIEPNLFAVERANELIQDATTHGTLAQLPAEDEPYDFITCVDVIEHLRRPDETLKHMHQRLKQDGGVMIVTNDISSLAAKLMGPKWVHYHLDHLWYFNRQSLKELVQSSGFEVVAVKRARKIFNFSYILGILAHSPNHRFLQRIAQSLSLIHI